MESESLTEPTVGIEDDKMREERDIGDHSMLHAPGEKIVTFDVWGVNAHLTTFDVPIKIEFFEISSGNRVYEQDMAIQLLQNQSTEVSATINVSKYDPSNLVGSVAFTVPSGQVLRSSADWPQPLKYINFDGRNVTVSVDGEKLMLHAKKPTKGVILDVDGDDDSGLEWSDNGFDIMPGETVNVTAKGLRGRKVMVNWYGKES